MSFVHVPSGNFLMGAGEFDLGVHERERPRHPVTITRDFYAGKTEVTQAQFERLMGFNPSRHKNPSSPVERVDFQDVSRFISRLNAREETASYRLPTEAEWEYFARAGTTSPYFFGDSPERLGEYAWYRENSGGRTRPVGGLSPNPWGLFDVYGNVSEMLSDWFRTDYYAESPRGDPPGPLSGSGRVLRGGSFENGVFGSRSSFRDYYPESGSEGVNGFRLVKEMEDGAGLR
jgi:formylglycine-generating enzyme required for sulfatase activity